MKRFLKTVLAVVFLLDFWVCAGQRVFVFSNDTAAKTVKLVQDDFSCHEQIDIGSSASLPASFALSFRKPEYIFMGFENRVIPLFISPSDSLVITLEPDSIRFEGKGSTNNRFLDSFEEEARHRRDAIQAYAAIHTPEEGLHFADSLYSRGRMQVTASMSITADLKSYLLNELAYTEAIYKVGVLEEQADKHQPGIGKTGIKRLESLAATYKLNNPDAILSKHYWDFLTDYYGLKGRILFLRNHSGIKTDNDIFLYNIIVFRLEMNELKGPVRDILLSHSLVNMIGWHKYHTLVRTAIQEYRGLCTNKNYLARVDTLFRNSLDTVDYKLSDLQYRNEQGKWVRLDSLKGKVVYVTFWASWCGICIAKMPSEKELVSKFGKQVTFINLSIDKNLTDWKKSLALNKPQGINLIAPKGLDDPLCLKFNLFGVPDYMLFDKNGKIADANAPSPGSKAIESTLRSLIAH